MMGEGALIGGKGGTLKDLHHDLTIGTLGLVIPYSTFNTMATP